MAGSVEEGPTTPRPEPNQPWDVARPRGGEHPGEERGWQGWETKGKDGRPGGTAGMAGPGPPSQREGD